MFAPQFFAVQYFAPNYWAPGTGEAETPVRRNRRYRGMLANANRGMR